MLKVSRTTLTCDFIENYITCFLPEISLIFYHRFDLEVGTSCFWREQAFSGPFIRKKGPFSPSCQEHGSWLAPFRRMECSFQTFHDILNLIVKGY